MKRKIHKPEDLALRKLSMRKGMIVKAYGCERMSKEVNTVCELRNVLTSYLCDASRGTVCDDCTGNHLYVFKLIKKEKIECLS